MQREPVPQQRFDPGEIVARQHAESTNELDLPFTAIVAPVILRGCAEIQSGASCGGTTPSASLRLLRDEPASPRRRASHLVPSRSQADPPSISAQSLSASERVEAHAGLAKDPAFVRVERAPSEAVIRSCSTISAIHADSSRPLPKARSFARRFAASTPAQPLRMTGWAALETRVAQRGRVKSECDKSAPPTSG